MEREKHAARRAHTAARAEKTGVRVDERGRQQAVAQEALRAVDVGQHHVQELRALDEAGLELRPLLRADDHRQRAQLPAPLGAAPVGVHVVGHAMLAQERTHAFAPLVQSVRAEPSDARHERAPVRAHRAVRSLHLVEDIRPRAVAGEEVGCRDGGHGPRTLRRAPRARQRGNRPRVKCAADFRRTDAGKTVRQAHPVRRPPAGESARGSRGRGVRHGSSLPAYRLSPRLTFAGGRAEVPALPSSMLGFFERQRLVKKGLASSKLRRRRTESEFLDTLEQGIVAKVAVFAALKDNESELFKQISIIQTAS